MKRPAVFCVIILALILFAGLSQTAKDPSYFSGQWYSSTDQTAYFFQEGLIYCSKYPVPVSENAFLSGAYVSGKQSILLFAAGVEGLETEKELYLVHKDNGSFLCEREDGSGKIYFIRYED